MKKKTVIEWLCIAFVSTTASAQSPSPQHLTPHYLNEDFIVDKPLLIENTHLRVKGNVILAKGGTLTVRNSTIEIINQFPREHSYLWRGGRLITQNVSIGGSSQNGIPRPSNFYLFDGRWDAVDTTVQYSYGILPGQGTKGGVLDAVRLKMGENPDSIIMQGRARVRLRDSRFRIGLKVKVVPGGKTFLEVHNDVPVTRVFDAKSIAGAEYRLELVNSVIPDRWFVFFQGIRSASSRSPDAHMYLAGKSKVIVGLMAWQLKGHFKLPYNPKDPTRFGNMILHKRSDMTFCCWSLYLSGQGTDVRLTGSTLLAEIMLRDGSLSVVGTPGKNDAIHGATTLNLGPHTKFYLENAILGRPLKWPSSKVRGFVEMKNGSRFFGKNVAIGHIDFLAKEGSYGLIKSNSVFGKVKDLNGSGRVKIVPQ